VSVRHAWLAAVCSLPALAGCGGSTSSSAPGAGPMVAAPAATVRSADCNLWRVMSSSERLRLIAGFKRFFGGPVDNGSGRGQVLGDKQATALFQGYCSQSFAGAFKLYKIYGRAAAFTPAPQ
jgi:hypothetical protein